MTIDRREFLSAALAGASAQTADASELTPSEIYRLLGFTTMTGEDPLRLWARLRDTRQWLAGPLAPDAWAC
jgi:hypothetical protein